MDFEGLICVVTGASSGIGEKVARDLAGRGAKVCLVARRQERLQAVLDSIGGAGAGHCFVVADVSKKTDVTGIGRAVRSTYGRCDLLINNAGISDERPLYEDGALADLERVMKVNFYGAVYCTAELLDLLIDSAPGNVVNVASVAGLLPLPRNPAYCASKFALAGWSESLAYQLDPKGVSVSVVEPGPIPTEGFPQSGLVNDRFLRFALGTTKDVSDAIFDAIENRKVQRVVPRWYYLLQFPRFVAPRAYRAVQRRIRF